MITSGSSFLIIVRRLDIRSKIRFNLLKKPDLFTWDKSISLHHYLSDKL